MSGLVHFAPMALAAVCWYGIHRFNRATRWFRVGEVIFWDVVLLIVFYLIWLIWF